jgi:threonine/homoserine/homoserine lactone efflux protein
MKRVGASSAGKLRTVTKGFGFGLLLQIAVGPVCLFVFSTAVGRGFFPALQAVLAVTLVDALFIFLAVAGIASLVSRPGVRRIVGIAGAGILILFGLSVELSLFGITIIPGFAFTVREGMNPFAAGLLVTGSNPLTILFWSGVFSARIADEGMDRAGMILFGSGAAVSTFAFLSAVSAAGHAAGRFLPATVICVLNGIVGAALIFFGVRVFLRTRAEAMVDQGSKR